MQMHCTCMRHQLKCYRPSVQRSSHPFRMRDQHRYFGCTAPPTSIDKPGMPMKTNLLRLLPSKPSDIERVRAWYAQLPNGPGVEPSRLTPWSLRELSRATGIPQAHLPTVLWQLGWHPYRPHGAPAAVELWQPPEWIEPHVTCAS